jgi:tetratricopeptide (TPR) repeat protein
MNRTIGSLLVLGLVVGAPGFVVAKPAKATTEIKPVEQPAAVQPAAVQSAAQPAAAKPAVSQGARSGKYTLEQAEALVNEAVAAKMRAISDKRRENIVKLQQLLDNPDYRKDQDRAPKVMHMLAEAYWEEGLYQYLQKRSDWDKAMASFNSGTLAEQPAEPIENYSQSLDLYRRVLREFPNYVRIDEVYYYLGKGAVKEGKAKKDRALQKEGVDYLNRLVQNYPKSRFIPESHLAMAEYYFETNSLHYAKINYEKIIQNFPKTSMYNYALYKLGWVYFNLREFDTAIETFQKVVSQVAKIEGKGVIEFKNQALNDLVVTYAEIDNGWQHAKDYFLKVLSEEDAYKKLRMLGDLYQGQDKPVEAVALFRHFIEREKTTASVTEYYKIILGIFKNTNDMPKLDETSIEALNYFKPNGTWWTVNRKDSESVAEADALCEEYLLYMANYYHRGAQKLNKADLYAKAAEKYSLYLGRFGESKNAYVVNFYYAEILYEQMKDFTRALEQYQRVVDRDTKGDYVEDAALGVIYCTQELMVTAGLQEVAKKGNIEVVKVDPKKLDAPIPETDLHPLEVSYVAGSDKYVDLLTELLKDPEVRKKNPQRGEKIPEIMYISAQVFYRHGKFQDAVERLQKLFAYDANSKFGAYAVFTLLDCYQRLQQWPKVEVWARKLIAAKNFTVKPEKDLRKIVAIAMTENARVLSVERKFGEASTEAMRVYEEFKGNEEVASKALFNVAALYEGQKEPEKAIKTYLRVVKEFPKSDVAPEALFTIGMIYESQTEFEKAAATFESMDQFKSLKEPAAGDPQEKKDAWKKVQEQMADALQNAGLLREALGGYQDAIEVYQKFVKQFPTLPETAKTDLRIGIVYEMKGDGASLRKAHDAYQAWLKKDYKRTEMTVEALARAGACLKQIDKVKERKNASSLFQRATDAFNKIGDNADALKASKTYAAQASFELADYLYDDFTLLTIPSTADPKVLKNALGAKAEAQQKAEKSFDQVLTYKAGGWSAGALFKMGLLYYDFYKELDNVPIPDCPCPGIRQKDCKTVQQAFKDGDFDTINKFDWGPEWMTVAPTFQDQYRAIIEEIMRPVQEKSLRAFEKALKLAHEEKVYNKFSKLCAEYAVKVNQDTFPVAGDSEVKANHEKDTLATTSFIRSLRRGGIEVKMTQEASR